MEVEERGRGVKQDVNVEMSIIKTKGGAEKEAVTPADLKEAAARFELLKKPRGTDALFVSTRVISSIETAGERLSRTKVDQSARPKTARCAQPNKYDDNADVLTGDVHGAALRKRRVH